MRAGFSKNAFQALENCARVAPSTTRWSADHETGKILVAMTLSGSWESKRGKRCILPNAPMHTCARLKTETKKAKHCLFPGFGEDSRVRVSFKLDRRSGAEGVAEHTDDV